VSFRLLLAVGLVIGLPALLQAQYSRTQLQRQQQQRVEIQGRIQGIAKGTLVVVANNNQTLRVALLPVTKIHVTGKTTTGALRAGLIVQFVAETNDHGAIQGKVDALTITSLTQDKQMGRVPSSHAKADDVVDGFGPNAKKDQDSGYAGGKRAKRPPKTAPRTQPAGSYRIIGRLIVGRGGALSVQVGRSTLPFELADQAKIDVDMADFSFVGRGNEVSVKGFVVAARPGMIQATEIKVKLPELQADENPEPADRHETKKPAKHPKKAKDKEEPEPEPGGDQ